MDLYTTTASLGEAALRYCLLSQSSCCIDTIFKSGDESLVSVGQDLASVVSRAIQGFVHLESAYTSLLHMFSCLNFYILDGICAAH